MLAARLLYMSQDDMWIQYPAKELCRAMSKPTRSGFTRIKKLVRFMGTGLLHSPYLRMNKNDC